MIKTINNTQREFLKYRSINTNNANKHRVFHVMTSYATLVNYNCIRP